MSLDLDLYRERLKVYKVNGKEGVVDSIKRQIENDFYNNPSYFSVLINDMERDVHITTDIKGQNKLLCLPNELINVGDSICWEGEYYICITIDDNSTIQSKGYIQKCNNIITFQTPDKIIHKIPCIITDRASVYSDGVEDGKYLRLPDGLIKIVIPNNEVTNTFDLLNKRIIFDHSKDSVFEVTKVSKLLIKGLIEIIAEVQQYDENIDNLEMNLSNYVEPDNQDTPTDSPTEAGYSISIIGDDKIKLIDTEPKIYVAKILSDGVEVDDKSVVWGVNNNRLKIINSTDTTCTIKADVGNYQYGKYILTAKLADDESILTEKVIEVVAW